MYWRYSVALSYCNYTTTHTSATLLCCCKPNQPVNDHCVLSMTPRSSICHELTSKPTKTSETHTYIPPWLLYEYTNSSTVARVLYTLSAVYLLGACSSILSYEVFVCTELESTTAVPHSYISNHEECFFSFPFFFRETRTFFLFRNI